MKNNKTKILKLIAIVAIILILIECINLFNYFSILNQERKLAGSLKKETPLPIDNNITNAPAIPESGIDSVPSKKEGGNDKVPKPITSEKIDQSILNYNKLTDPLEKASYFNYKLLDQRKSICNIGEQNKEMYKKALLETYQNLATIIPQQSTSNFVSLCNMRDDLEFAMKKLGCPIDPTIQNKLRKKCLQ